MPKDDNDFTVKDYERIIDDIIDEYFDQHDINYDMKDLFKAGMLGETPQQEEFNASI